MMSSPCLFFQSSLKEENNEDFQKLYSNWQAEVTSFDGAEDEIIVGQSAMADIIDDLVVTDRTLPIGNVLKEICSIPIPDQEFTEEEIVLKQEDFEEFMGNFAQGVEIPIEYLAPYVSAPESDASFEFVNTSNDNEFECQEIIFEREIAEKVSAMLNSPLRGENNYPAVPEDIETILAEKTVFPYVEGNTSNVVKVEGSDVSLPAGSIVLAVVGEKGSLIHLPVDPSAIVGLPTDDLDLNVIPNCPAEISAIDALPGQEVIDNFADLDVESNHGNQPALEAGDLQTLLEEFEASEKITTMEYYEDSSSKPLTVKMEQIDADELSHIEEEISYTPKKPKTNSTNKEIMDSLPKEIIDKIKASTKKNTIKLITDAPMPHKKRGRKAKTSKETSPNGKYNIKRYNNIKNECDGTAETQIDHTYCSPLKEKAAAAGTFNKLPEYFTSPVSIRVINVSNNSEEETSKKDSGVESGGVSDAGEVDLRKANSLNLDAIIPEMLTDPNLYCKIPDYLTDISNKASKGSSDSQEDAIKADSSADSSEATTFSKVKRKLKLSEYRQRLQVNVSRKSGTLVSPQKQKKIHVPVIDLVCEDKPKKFPVGPVATRVENMPQQPRPHSIDKKPIKLNSKKKHPREEETATNSLGGDSLKMQQNDRLKHLANNIPLSRMPTTSIGHSLLFAKRRMDSLAPNNRLVSARHRRRSRSSSSSSSSSSSTSSSSSLTSSDSKDSGHYAKGRRKRLMRERRSRSRSPEVSRSKMSRMRSRSREHRKSCRRWSKSRSPPPSKYRRRSYSRSRSRERRYRSRSRSISCERRSRSRSCERRCRSRSRSCEGRYRCRSRCYSSYTSYSSRSRSRSKSSSRRRNNRSYSRSRDSWSTSHGEIITRSPPGRLPYSTGGWSPFNGDAAAPSYANFIPYQPTNRQRLGEARFEERKCIYVGCIEEGMTKADLRKRFQSFGEIMDISVHFRERGDNYGFVTFMHGHSAHQAIEHGNDDTSLSSYNLCFGGRRQFCKVQYSDLDDQSDGFRGRKFIRPPSSADYDSLLKDAIRRVQ